MNDMNPGRELDAEIAEKVMELTLNELSGARYADVLPKYSTDIAAAWQVVEKMFFLTTSGDFKLVTYDGGTSWTAEFAKILDVEGTVLSRTERYSMEAGTPAHAICLAAIKVVSSK